MHINLDHYGTAQPTCTGVELEILSRRRIDNDGPKSACQSANFQMNQWLGRFQPRELHKHLLRGSQLDRSTLRQEFEQLHQAWPWSGLARFVRHTDAPTGVASGPPGAGSALLLPPFSFLNACHPRPVNAYFV
jgi:hypothetical protein